MAEAGAFDAIVVGGGMVGAALAARLGGAGRRVAVVESRPPQVLEVAGDYDLRVSALGIAAERLLTALAAWPEMRRLRVSPYREMRVWDAGSTGAIHFHAAELGLGHLGHIVENRVVQSALWQRLLSIEAVSLLAPALPTGLRVEPEAAVLEIEGGGQLRAPLVIGADGAASALRTLAGIDCVVHDYAQRGVVCTVRTELDHQHTAWQRFLASGPLAFLPLADGRCSIVWTCPGDRAQELLDLAPQRFATDLEAAFDARLGRIEQVGQRAAFSLRRQHARHYVRPRVALVGDAAHTIHPLAGQGVNLGLLDAAALAQVLLADSGDWGRLGLLRRYERWRRGDNELMLQAMDAFQWLFAHSSGPLPLVRGAGLSLTDRCGVLKRAFMRHASGLAGDLPDLVREAGQPH